MLVRSDKLKKRLQGSASFALALALALPSLGLAEELPAPQNLKVTRQDTVYKGRWSAVKGSAYYEVWVEKFGRWSFNKKNLATSPFTSSFEFPVEDERSRFRVRAVDSSGHPGAFSSEVRAVKGKAATTSARPVVSNKGGKASPQFDPKAPAPEPPTSLFAVWTDSETIKLVWRGPEEAVKYSVEELKNGSWVSIPKIEFPKKNTALIKSHPTPGPYKFRVRSVGSNGRASKPSRTTTAKR